MDLLRELNSAQVSLFRLEQFQEYAEDDEVLNTFKKSGTVDLSRNEDWYDFVRTKKALGVQMERVRVVKEPKNLYTTMELMYHKEAVRHGDGIFVLDFNTFQKLDIMCKDFWLLDNKRVIELNFNANMDFLGYNERFDIDYFSNIRKVVIAHATLMGG